MVRQRPVDDARPAGKLYPEDAHSRNHPHHEAADPGGGFNRPQRLSDLERRAPGTDPREMLAAYTGTADRTRISSRTITPPANACRTINRPNPIRTNTAPIMG